MDHNRVKWDVVGIDMKPNEDLEQNILVSADLALNPMAQVSSHPFLLLVAFGSL